MKEVIKIDTLTKLKIWLTAMIGLMSEWLGMFGTLLVILFILFVLDFLTALLSATSGKAKARTEKEKKKLGVKSELAFDGAKKKVGYIFLVAVSCVADCFIFITTDFIGIKLPFTMFFATFVTAWLALNEMISILENLDRSGITLPSWLIKVICQLKINVDKTVEEQLEKVGFDINEDDDKITEDETADKID